MSRVEEGRIFCLFLLFVLAGFTGGQVEPDMLPEILCTICPAPTGAPGRLRGGGRERMLTAAPQQQQEEEKATKTGLQADEDWALSAGAPELASVLPGDAECDSPDPSGHH